MRSLVGGKSCPKIGSDGLAEAGLIVLHDEEIVPLPFDDFLADITLTKHGIAGDNSPSKHEIPQQFQGGFGLIRFFVNPRLAESAARRVIEQRQ